jgi:acetyl-CoA acetyltransferase
MNELRDAVICTPLRTPVGRYGGMFKELPAEKLVALIPTAIVERAGLDPARIDDVVFGQCYPSGEAPVLGRVAALGIEVPGLQLDRRCGSTTGRGRIQDLGTRPALDGRQSRRRHFILRIPVSR